MNLKLATKDLGGRKEKKGAGGKKKTRKKKPQTKPATHKTNKFSNQKNCKWYTYVVFL